MKSNPNRGYGKHATTGFLERPRVETASKNMFKYRWPTSERRSTLVILNKAECGTRSDFET